MFKPPTSLVPLSRVFLFVSLLQWMYCQPTQSVTVAPLGGTFIPQLIYYDRDTHYLQYWQGGFFDRTSLHALGFVYYLGHDGDPCPVESQPRGLMIIDMNGRHKVRIGFCTCGISRNERYRQLLRMNWYPASFSRPMTAFSFDLLETYHKVTLQGKLNLYDFYHAIMQKTDNQGRSKVMVSDIL